MERSIQQIASCQVPMYFSLFHCEGLYESMYTVVSQEAWCFTSSRSNVPDYIHFLSIYCLTCNAIELFYSPKVEPGTVTCSFTIRSANPTMSYIWLLCRMASVASCQITIGCRPTNCLLFKG